MPVRAEPMLRNLSAMSTTDANTLVEDRLTTLLEELDPKVVDSVTFRGRQYDLGLAWVHLPLGRGGLGLAPTAQREIDRRLREAGAASIETRFL